MTVTLDALRVATQQVGYTLLSPLGKGSEGAVFRAQCGASFTALKFFLAPDPQRLQREISLLSSLSCPHLVRLLDFRILPVSGQQVPMAVYELVDGPTLRSIIASPGTASGAQVVAIGAQVGAAIEALWGARIVHRDVKPENIVRAGDGRCVLVDVGIAQHLNLSTITGAAGQPGTPGYRSPEQCGARCRLTVHSDVFSLGVTLFEVATKKHPWNRNEASMRCLAPTMLALERPDLDLRVANLVHQMLSRRPALRPSDPGRRFTRLGGL